MFVALPFSLFSCLLFSFLLCSSCTTVLSFILHVAGCEVLMFVAVRFSSLVYSTFLVFLSWLVVVFSFGVVFSFPLAVVFLFLCTCVFCLGACLQKREGGSVSARVCAFRLMDKLATRS